MEANALPVIHFRWRARGQRGRRDPRLGGLGGTYGRGRSVYPPVFAKHPLYRRFFARSDHVGTRAVDRAMALVAA